MANIFEKVRDYLNQPFPGAPGKKAPAKPSAKPGSTEEKAPDVQTALRNRELALRRAERNADLAEKQKLARERKVLEDLRHKYEAELAEQAKAHTSRTEWTHTVVPGDTLSGIAKKYYGKAARWPEIHAANKHLISNPNLIYPGQVFAIPEADDD